ncbi:MAG: hypothetical protein WA738_08390 [Candidatus Angelobacter sp.]
MWWTWLIPIAAAVAVTLLEIRVYHQRTEQMEKMRDMVREELGKIKKEIIEEIRSQSVIK